MFRSYFKNLYQRTMREAYALAIENIVEAVGQGGAYLHCGANDGGLVESITDRVPNASEQYHGIEWNAELVAQAKQKKLNVTEGDLNHLLPYADEKFNCVFALSVLEHLLYPCKYLQECKRVLKPGGSLVLLTPNISTFFTAFLILAGRMPSSGPHPDSNELINSRSPVKVSSQAKQVDTEGDTPAYRHLVVFSYLELKRYLKLLDLQITQARGFGLYPFPNFTQPILEKIDPYHCHQMVFVARKNP